MIKLTKYLIDELFANIMTAYEYSLRGESDSVLSAIE